MKVIKLNCSACGAPISIPDTVTQFNCASCGSLLTLEQGEGYYALKATEKIVDAIRSSSNDQVKEMRRTQLIQSRERIEDKLMEKREEYAKAASKRWTKFTPSILEQLIFQEWSIAEDYRRCEMELDLLDGPKLEKNELALKNQINWIDHSIMILSQLNKNSMYYDLIDSMKEEKALYFEFLDDLKHSAS
jgi:DNA-directed RNA polymerase subunit RPC12/RpoP